MIKHDLLQKQIEETEQFFSRLIGEGYEEKIKQRFPKADISFTKAELPEVGRHQVWCCDCGCGEKIPVLIPAVTRSSIHWSEGLISAEIIGVWVSPCTNNYDDNLHYGMFLWDEIEDQQIEGVKLPGN